MFLMESLKRSSDTFNKMMPTKGAKRQFRIQIVDRARIERLVSCAMCRIFLSQRNKPNDRRNQFFRFESKYRTHKG